MGHETESAISHDRKWDSTLALLAEGYTFIAKRCQRYQSDIFATRPISRVAICIMGEEAVQVFSHLHVR
jgi:fatty-acid peroxygenase